MGKRRSPTGPLGDFKYMGLGIELVVGTLVGAFIGYRLDLYFHSRPWLTLVGIIIGTAAGFKNMLELLRDKEKKG